MTTESPPTATDGGDETAPAASRQSLALWSSSQRLADITRRMFAGASTTVAVLFLLSQLLILSTFSNLAGPAATQMLFALSLASIATGVLMALYEGQLLCVAAAAAVGALLLLQAYVFSWLTGVPVNLRVLFSYANMVAFPIFSLRGLRLNRIFALLFLSGLAYGVGYIAGHDHFIATAQGALDQARLTKGEFAQALRTGVRVLPGDSSRGLRVMLAGTFISFSLFYALVRLRGGRGWRWLVPIGITTSVIVMSQSRSFMAMIALVTVAYLLRLAHRPQRIAAAGAFLAAALVILSGVPFPDWNPLEMIASDSSGAVRARAYGIIADLVGRNFVSGVGIAPSAEAANRLVAVPSVFWSDLGVLGIWYTFGLFGVLLYCAQVVVVMVGYRLPADLNPANQHALVLCGVVVGLTAVMTPDMWGGGGGVIAAISIGLLLRQPTPPRTSPLWYFVGLLRDRKSARWRGWLNRRSSAVSFWPLLPGFAHT